jgi:thiol:disulfide interchange protein
MNTRIFLLLFSFIAFQFAATAQDNPAPVQWSFSSEGQGKDAKLIFKASIAPGWKLYSLSASDDQPNTRIQADSASADKLDVPVEKGNLLSNPEPLFDNARIPYYENEVQIEIPLKVDPSADGGQYLNGTILYMALKGEEIVGPEEVPFRYQISAGGELVAAGLKTVSGNDNSLKRTAIRLDNPVASCGGTGIESASGGGLLNIFILGFLGGLIALFTPCVFPMIPLTVSFFTKKSQDKKKGVANAMLYGFFIFLIYILLSAPFHLMDSLNPEILNNISTNVWLNLLFFVIFVVFALSFFGLFEITLPSSLSNSVDSKSGIGGGLGIFFMALTLALVSFSCTGPILGSLLAGSLSTDGGAMQLTAGMGGFGLALALPFAVFAFFPNLLSAIPKSGGWLTTVKIVLGFVELALAMKFLSNADLVMHWGLLKREVFFAIWILISAALTLYLFGVIRFRHEGPVKKLSNLRVGFAVVFGLFTLYLLPGLTNSRYANLALISGFPPPLTYSVYSDAGGKGLEPEVINDYEKALALAKEQNKPLLIDFTGWACVNCRKMEENVWPQPAIHDMISENFILVSLYVDDRKKLPEDQQFIYEAPGGVRKEIKTIGDKFATFQTENFKNASQPLYVVLSPDEKLLNNPVGYTPDADEYLQWLQCGLDAFRK